MFGQLQMRLRKGMSASIALYFRYKIRDHVTVIEIEILCCQDTLTAGDKIEGEIFRHWPSPKVGSLFDTQ